LFGYIRPQKSELLVREYEQYKGVYCALCRQLGKSYGIISRLTLSYDCTFYALLLMALSDECCEFEKGRCTVNPLKKCIFCKTGEKELIKASAISVILTYFKIRDDVVDSHFWGKLRAYLLLPIASSIRKKAARDFPKMDKIISSAMEKQKLAESDKNSVMDFYAEPSAKMLGEIFELSVDKTDENYTQKVRVLQQIGYFLGRWVYLIDAGDDIEKDIKNGSFNPYILKYNLNATSSQEDIMEVKKYANQALNLTISQITAALNILDFNCYDTIIKNVIFKGLPEIQKELLYKKEKMHV